MRIIAGEWRGRRIAAPRGRGVRPTADRIREAWMSAMGARFDGLQIWDLFAGSGALGLECLSRGAAHCTFVEQAPASLQVIRANIDTLGAGDRARVVQADALRWATAAPPAALPDLALADPPYGTGVARALIEAFAAAPFALELWVEHRTDDDVPDLPRLHRRRYGATTLSTLDAPARHP